MQMPNVDAVLPGPRSEEINGKSDGLCLGGVYPRNRSNMPVVFEHGDGSYVWDRDGNCFIDFCFTLTASLGHGEPRVQRAAQDAFASIANTSNYLSPYVVQLASQVRKAGGSRYAVQFFSSGAEAVEAGMWFARAISGKDEFISFFGSNHGKTQAAISLASMKPWHGKRAPGFIRVPYASCRRCFYGLSYPSCQYRCVAALDQFIDQIGTGQVAAVVVEPIQGTRVEIPPAGYLSTLTSYCRRRGILLMADEIMTGLGRCGKMLESQWHGVEPDIVVLGKSLANGLPISAVLVHDQHLSGAREVVGSTTFGGNPLCCRVASRCMEILEQDGLVGRAAELEQLIAEALQPLGDRPGVGRIHGRGCLWGVECIDADSGDPSPTLCKRVAEQLMREGVICFSGGGMLQITPALNVPREVLVAGLEIVVRTVRRCC
jgi:4-aminobutyrate aminotransferase-like enzyme